MGGAEAGADAGSDGSEELFKAANPAEGALNQLFPGGGALAVDKGEGSGVIALVIQCLADIENGDCTFGGVAGDRYQTSGLEGDDRCGFIAPLAQLNSETPAGLGKVEVRLMATIHPHLEAGTRGVAGFANPLDVAFRFEGLQEAGDGGVGRSVEQLAEFREPDWLRRR